MFILKGYIMGLNVKEYRTKVEKTQNKTVQNKNYMSDTEKQELCEYLKKFGIDLP